VSGKPQIHAPGAAAFWWPGALFVLLVLVVYADPLFLRRNFAGRDLVAYNLPMEKSVHDAYARHRLPVWMPEASGGRPLLPNPNIGALYPVRPLLSLLPFPLAMRVFPVLHWALSGVGMIVLLLSMGVSRAAAWVGAVTYAFSGVAVSEAYFPHVAPGMALLPWILWALQRKAATFASSVLGLSMFFALDFLAGDVFTIALAVGCCLLWILFEVNRAERGREVLRLCGALFLASLLAGPQIVATGLWIPETNRAIRGMKLDEAFLYSIHPLRLLEFLIPFPFGATSSFDHAYVWGFPIFRGRALGLFSTLYAGSFALVAFFSMRGIRVTGARFARVLFLLTLALSVPPSLLPESWRSLASPLPLRNPEKFAVTLVFALAILAGVAFDRYCQPARRPRTILAVGILLAALSTLTWLLPGPTGTWAVRLVGAEPGLAGRAGQLLPGAIAAGALLWIMTAIAVELLRRTSRLALFSSLALLTLCVILPNREIARTLHEEEVLGPTRFARVLERIDPARAYRVVGESIFHPESDLAVVGAGFDLGQTEFPRRSWTQLTGALWDRGTVFNYDYDVGDFARLESLRRVPHIAPASTDLAAFFGGLALRFGVRYPDQEGLPGYRAFGGNRVETWEEHLQAFPDIRLARRWREAEDAPGALGELLRLGPGEIVLETGRRAVGMASAGRLRIFEKSPERIRLEADAPEAAWLFVLRGYWSHREVAIDGRPAECVPAQLAFSAVRVPAGRHRIEWREKVPGGRVSRWGPVIFALAAAGLLARERRLSRPM